MARRLQLLPLLFALVIAACSCSHPTQPQATDSVTISGKKSGLVQVPYSFKASINFTSSAELIYKWVFSDTTMSGNGLDSISRSFADTGTHIFTLHVIRTGDNAELCSATDTIIITDTTTPPRNPNDTSSHNFTWTVYTNVNGENNMTGCWVFGSNDIYAVNGDLHHFDGSSWSTIVVHDAKGQSYQGGLSGSSLWGFSDNDLWITGSSGALHYLGNGLVQPYSTYYMNHGRIHSAWGTSSTDMYFVGDSGLIAHFDGTNWTKMNSGTTKELNSISGTSDNDIWAAGYNISTGESELVHWNGSMWSKDSLSTAGVTANWGINGVFASDSAGLQTIASTGWTVYRRTDHAPWRSDSGIVPNDVGGRIWMSGINGNGANDLFTVGNFGLICHWNGKSWYRYDALLNTADVAFGIEGFSVSGNTACAVGQKDGNSWIAIGQRK